MSRRKNSSYKQIVISPEDFVVAWTTSESMKDFCDLTGLTPDAAKQRAKRLRGLGVKLKEMPRMKYYLANDTLRISQLNSLVKKHTS